MNPYVVGGPPRFAHQTRGLRKMIETGGRTALLFDPGTGKTATALDYMGLLALKSPTGEARVLVVCPLAAVDTWVEQAEAFVSPQVSLWAETLGGSIVNKGEALAARGGRSHAQGGALRRGEHPRALHQGKALDRRLRGDGRATPSGPGGPDSLGDALPRLVIEVMNVDALSSRAVRGSGTVADFMVESIRRYAPDLVVVDESHRIKSANGNASRLLARLVPFVPRRVILTGTVMPHSPLDVYGQWRFLDPYAFGTKNRAATFGNFRAAYATMGGYMGRQVTGFHHLDDMQKIMARNAEVARKDECLDLPPTTDVIVPVDLSPAERRAYAQMKVDLAAQLDLTTTATVPNRLTQMLRLRQITSGYLPDDTGQTFVLGESKVATIRSIVHDNLAGERRIVVFCYFSHEVQALGERLAAGGTTVLTISGSTPPDVRKSIRKRFGSDDPARLVLVCQVKTMSLAVNELVTASHAVFGSLSQQRDDLEQARARLDRQGQKRPVTFWYAVVHQTVDEVILRSHRDRTDLETAMLRHIRDGEDAAMSVPQKEAV